MSLTDAGLPIQHNVPLGPFTSFGIGGAARFFASADSEEAVAEAVDWATRHRQSLAILGGGSNLLIGDAGFDGLVLRIAIPGFRSTPDGILHAGAGEPWDTLVDRAIANELAGIECLAGIPGLTGGTPVQNVGAYGQEVAETIASVRVFDRHTLQFSDLDHNSCSFGYRQSRFNHDEPGRFIVTQVRFTLRPGGLPTLRYRDLERHFAHAAGAPSLAQVARTVRDIRRSKGMLLTPGDPDCRSAGSYFKNPIVSEVEAAHIAEAAGLPLAAMPHWPAGRGCTKLAAAWLLEHAGVYKGYGSGSAGISSRHTLALINRGKATAADILALEAEIRSRVQQKFSVTLTREPVLLGSVA